MLEGRRCGKPEGRRTRSARSAESNREQIARVSGWYVRRTRSHPTYGCGVVDGWEAGDRRGSGGSWSRGRGDGRSDRKGNGHQLLSQIRCSGGIRAGPEGVEDSLSSGLLRRLVRATRRGLWRVTVGRSDGRILRALPLRGPERRRRRDTLFGQRSTQARRTVVCARRLVRTSSSSKASGPE